MAKATVRNAHNGPMDVQTLDGMQRVPAMGELTANFDEAYLKLLESAGVMSVELVAEKEKPKEKPGAETKKKGRN